MNVILHSFIAIIVLNGFRIKLVGADVIPMSDLALGAMESHDQEIVSLTKSHDPASGLELEAIKLAITSDRYRFAYITAEESGKYPDAEVHVLDGGPGKSYFVLDISCGPSGGWNYTIKAYGHAFANRSSANSRFGPLAMLCLVFFWKYTLA